MNVTVLVFSLLLLIVVSTSAQLVPDMDDFAKLLAGIGNQFGVESTSAPVGSDMDDFAKLMAGIGKQVVDLGATESP